MPSPLRDQTAYLLIGILSAVILGFLFWLIYVNAPAGSPPAWTLHLPAINAALNSLSAVCLVSAVIAIRRKHPHTHVRFICAALTFSGFFLISYITHKTYHGDTPFTGEGWIRTLYFSILAPHVILSMVMVPLIFVTVFFALTGRYPRHRRLARWTFPIWLFVSVSGVLVFAFLSNNPREEEHAATPETHSDVGVVE